MSGHPSRPNILLIMTDQQRTDSLGCYGSPFARTPNVDALAADGVVFENCYVQNPLCCPSRHSFLTGRYPHSHGVRSNWYHRKPDETSFAHQLGRAGYRSAIVGKMHLTPWHENFGFDGRIIADGKGFSFDDDYGRYLRHLGYGRGEMYPKDDADFDRLWGAGAWRLPPEAHIDAYIGRASYDYLRQTTGPWCLVASFCGPHNPFDPPPPYDAVHEETVFPGRNMTPGEPSRRPREPYDYIARVASNLGAIRPDDLSDDDLQRIKRLYHGNVTQIDDWVGRLVAILKETGQYDDTLIVFTSDHGDMLGDHGLIFKQCFYEESVRVPLVVHWPAKFGAGRSDALVESLDLLSTFCDVADVYEGEGRQGASLVPLLANEVEHVRDAAFSENYFARMMRTDQHKLVYHVNQPYGEIYDLGEDPLEQNNLWDALDGSPTKARLLDQLLEWSFASEDPTPLPARRGHIEPAVPTLEMRGGRAVEQDRQPWHLDHMRDFYEHAEPAEPGILR